MNPLQESDRSLRETIAPAELAVTAAPPVDETDAETPLPPLPGDARDLSATTPGRSSSSLAFVATPPSVTIASYGSADVGTLLGAMAGLQPPGAVQGPEVAGTVAIVVTAGLDAGDLLQGLQAGSLPPIASDVLESGIRLAQTGDYRQIHTDAITKVQASAELLGQLAPQMSAGEVVHFTVAQDGIEVQQVVADETVEKADKLRAGDGPIDVIIVEDPAPASAPVPRKPLNLPKGVSRELVDTITQAVAPQAAARTGKPGHCSRKLRLGDTRRERIMTLASDFMGTGFSGGDKAKLQQFEQAVKLASTKGLKVDDHRYKDVTTYLQKLVANNPRLDNMIRIRNGVIRIDAPQNLFSDFDKVSSLVGLALILTNNDRPKQQQMRDLLLAASAPGGLDLNDPKLGPLARQALAIAKEHLAVFGEDLFQEKDGRLVISLEPKELQDLQAYYSYFDTDTPSAAARQMAAVQNEAIAATNASITASASVIVALHMLEALSLQGLAPTPTGPAAGLASGGAGPAPSAEPLPADTSRPMTPPVVPAAPEPVKAEIRTVLPPEVATLGPSYDAAHQDYLTAIRKADQSLADQREARLRTEAERLADIKAAGDQMDRHYDTALDKQAQRLRELQRAMEAEAAARD